MKSPIKSNLLKSPGDSLSKKIYELIEIDVAHYLFVSGFSLVLAALEWWRWYIDAKPSPIIYSIVALAVVFFSAWKVVHSIRKIRRYQQGLKGEIAVGQFLDELRSNELKILHDISAKEFNVDHVLICTAGIFVIETKTLLKPDIGEPKIIFDGDQVIKNGFPLERNPVSQAKAVSKWIEALLKESTGRYFSTKPVVVFPGWFVETKPDARNSDSWVLNPKALPTYLNNSKPSLSLEEINLCYFHLKRYVRNSSE